MYYLYLLYLVNIWISADILCYYLFNTQFGRAMSQARGKSKEHLQNYLAQVFPDRTFDSSGRISDPCVKEARAKALVGLAEKDQFIWEPPIFKTNEDGTQSIEKNARDPFTGPYIRNALRYLFLEDSAEWKQMPKEFTVGQIAFTVTLVCFFYIWVLWDLSRYVYYIYQMIVFYLALPFVRRNQGHILFNGI